MPEPLISVALCTYNRAWLLPRVLASLRAQSLAPEAFEVIAVDNNSSDETPRVLAREAKSWPGLRVVREDAQGLSHARNRGWREARGRYVAYLDDDCLAPAGWLAAAERQIAARAPEALGGPYLPFYASPRPAWFRHAYGAHLQGRIAHALPARQYLDGGNMLWRRELLAELGGFDPRLGMSGASLGYGEEVELQDRLRAARPGAVVWYHPGLMLYHLVRPERMRLSFALRDALAHGRAHAPASGPGLLRALAASAWHLGPGTLLRCRAGRPYWQQHVYERGLPALEALGAALARRRR